MLTASGGLAAILLAMQITPAQTVTPAGPDGPAVAASDIVTGILSYTRWPDSGNHVRLCVGGATPLSARLSDQALPDGRRVSVSRRETATMPGVDCDAVFVGRGGAADLRRIASLSANRAVVTITDGDPDCGSGFMACLRPTPNGLTFDLNIDAVSRSRVRIDPRVLILGRRGA